MKMVKEIANYIDSMITMTTDVPSNYTENKVPMLDVKVWMQEERRQIYYEFYEKPTKNQLVMSKDSAMPKSKKIDALSQEVFRRIHNTKHEIEWERKIIILEKYMTELKASGYSDKDRFEILRSGINRYENLRREEDKGEIPVFRSKTNNKFTISTTFYLNINQITLKDISDAVTQSHNIVSWVHCL